MHLKLIQELQLQYWDQIRIIKSNGNSFVANYKRLNITKMEYWNCSSGNHEILEIDSIQNIAILNRNDV